MSETVIRLENVSRSFGERKVLSDINMCIQKGEVFGYLGPNGAGKTTTIRILLGLIEPSSGRAEVLGQDANTRERTVREQVGVVLEDHGLYERLSAYENLDYYACIYRLSPQQRQKRIRLLLEQVELWNRRDDLVGVFSKGMKQKLALARALVHEPAVLFVDEPTAGLDPTAAQAIRQFVIDIVRRDGRTVFMTSHNLNEVEQMCSRIAILQSGHLYAMGTIADLRRRIESPQLAIFANQPSALPALAVQVKALPFVVNCEINFDHLLVQLAKEVPPTGLWEALAYFGIAIDEIKKVGMSLEEMYLDIVSKAEKVDDEPGSDRST